MPRAQNFLPTTTAARKRTAGADVHDFRRGRPCPEGLSKNFAQKKFALIVWPLANVVALLSGEMEKLL